MNLEQLIASFRVDADDLHEPYLFQEEWIAGWLSEAQEEAAIRGRLIFDDATPAVCQIAVAAGKAAYTLHGTVTEIADLRFFTNDSIESTAIPLVSREWLQQRRPCWRNDVGEPAFAIQTDLSIRLVPTPNVDGMLRLEVHRLPLKALENDTDKPEIHGGHHRHLVHWALYRAFSRPDSETIDAQRADRALGSFSSYFGPRPDSDLRRITRHDQPQTNEIW